MYQNETKNGEQWECRDAWCPVHDKDDQEWGWTDQNTNANAQNDKMANNKGEHTPGINKKSITGQEENHVAEHTHSIEKYETHQDLNEKKITEHTVNRENDTHKNIWKSLFEPSIGHKTIGTRPNPRAEHTATLNKGIKRNAEGEQTPKETENTIENTNKYKTEIDKILKEKEQEVEKNKELAKEIEYVGIKMEKMKINRWNDLIELKELKVREGKLEREIEELKKSNGSKYLPMATQEKPDPHEAAEESNTDTSTEADIPGTTPEVWRDVWSGYTEYRTYNEKTGRTKVITMPEGASFVGNSFRGSKTEVPPGTSFRGQTKEVLQSERIPYIPRGNKKEKENMEVITEYIPTPIQKNTAKKDEDYSRRRKRREIFGPDMENMYEKCPNMAIQEKPKLSEEGIKEKSDKIKNLEEKIREMEYTARRNENEIQSLKIEIERKNEEIRKYKQETEDIIKKQHEIEKKPPVVEITDENRWRIVKELGGMIKNDDNTYSATPQSLTWARNQRTQLKDTYMVKPKKEAEIAELEWHPNPTNLKLKWTHEGYWTLIPIKQGKIGTVIDTRYFRVARVELYIDTDGVIRKAVSYGADDSKLITWYNMEEIKQTLPEWRHEEPTVYYNTRRFNWKIRWNSSEETPVDQPYEGIQGGRNIKGRGGISLRDRNTYRNRGRNSRGRPSYRGKGRPIEGGNTWLDEYEIWNDSQEDDYGYERDNDKKRKTKEETVLKEAKDRRYNRQDIIIVRDRKRSESRDRANKRRSLSRERPQSRRGSNSRNRSNSPRNYRKQEEDRDRNERRKSVETHKRNDQEENREKEGRRRTSPSPRRGRYREKSPNYEHDRKERGSRRRSYTPEHGYRGRDPGHNK